VLPGWVISILPGPAAFQVIPSAWEAEGERGLFENGVDVDLSIQQIFFSLFNPGFNVCRS
jgi:hypothetical protein